MVRNYESSKKVVLAVMKDRRNRAIILSPVKRKESVNIDFEGFRSIVNQIFPADANKKAKI
jgi:hypothetical protein